MWRRPIVPALMVAALLIGAAPARGAIITIESLTVQPNTPFTLSVGISDVDDLIAFSFNVMFDPLVVALDAVQGGNFLSRGGLTLPCTVPDGPFPCPITDTNPTERTVAVGNFLVDGTGVSDNGAEDVLAFLTFTSLTSGPALFTVSDILLVSLVGTDTVDEFLGPVNGTVTVEGGPAPIPEPATLVLVAGAGLVGIARRKWRRSGRTPCAA